MSQKTSSHTPAPNHLHEQTSLACEAIDTEHAIIRGVKLLGLESKNGRHYLDAALAEAVTLYEGAKVNINHPKGNPLAPRDYQDRLGVVRNVCHRPGDGLFGDLHFNPKHALAEQLIWDAQSQPTNVGLSHNVLANTSKAKDGKVTVEAITRVNSIDIVPDPATTNGLFEQTTTPALTPQPPTLNPTNTAASFLPPLSTLTVEELRAERADLCEALTTNAIQEATATVRINVSAALKALMAAQLPYNAWDSGMLDAIVMADTVEHVNTIIAARKALVEQMRRGLTPTPPTSAPKPEPKPLTTEQFARMLK